MLFSRPGKEPLGGCNIKPLAQEKVDGAAFFVHGAVQVDPFTPNLDISLVHPPRIAHRQGISLPAFLKFRNVTLDPPKNGRMGQPDSALGHHLDQVAGAEFKGQVPPHAMISWSKCRHLKRSCAEVGSVIPGVTAVHRAFQAFAPEPFSLRFDCKNLALK
jgi:hypothetical protein